MPKFERESLPRARSSAMGCTQPRWPRLHILLHAVQLHLAAAFQPQLRRFAQMPWVPRQEGAEPQSMTPVAM